MSNDNNEDVEQVVSVLSDTTMLDEVNTVPVNFSVPPNSSILIISPHEHGFLFQRQNTITPESVDMDAVSAGNLLATIMWALMHKPKLFPALYEEMVAEDLTITPVAGHA